MSQPKIQDILERINKLEKLQEILNKIEETKDVENKEKYENMLKEYIKEIENEQ